MATITVAVASGAAQTTAITDAFSSANSGDTVRFSGTYVISNSSAIEINPGSGIDIEFTSSSIIKSDDPDTPREIHFIGTSGTPMHNIDVSGWRAEDVYVLFKGESAGDAKTFTFTDGEIINGLVTVDSQGHNYSVVFERIDGLTVEDCYFHRRHDSVGRTLYFFKCQNWVCRRNRWTGFMMTGINANGVAPDQFGSYPNNDRNYNFEIYDNLIERGDGQIGTDYQDHGMYVWGANKGKIYRNTVSGWTMAAFGGGLKLRNSQDIEVCRNTFCESGLHMFANTSVKDGNGFFTVYPLLKDIVVDSNRIILYQQDPYDVADAFADRRLALNFARDSDSGLGESNISITNNDLINGNVEISTTNGVQPNDRQYFNIVGNRYDSTAGFTDPRSENTIWDNLLP